MVLIIDWLENIDWLKNIDWLENGDWLKNSDWLQKSDKLKNINTVLYRVKVLYLVYGVVLSSFHINPLYYPAGYPQDSVSIICFFGLTDQFDELNLTSFYFIIFVI